MLKRENRFLAFIEGTLNSQKYIEILQTYLLPAMNQLFGNETWKFMQDHASSHDAKNTQLWLSQNLRQFYGKEDWPAKSPDLNPIENLWSILKEKIDRQKVQTITGLKKSIINSWNSIDVNDLHKLIDSMKTRRSQVRTSKGGYTKY